MVEKWFNDGYILVSNKIKLIRGIIINIREYECIVKIFVWL